MKHALLTTTAMVAYAGDNGTEITTPVGRIVWGHPSKSRPKTDQHNQKVLDDQGNQVMEVAFGLAIPSDQFAAHVWPAIAAEIAKGYPAGAPGNFSYKITQAHEIDRQGKPYGEREGYAGCTVLAVSTMLQAPGVFKFEQGAYRQMRPEEIKCGDFVRVGVGFKINVPTNRAHTPSIYVNPLAVEFIGYGTEIVTGFQADPNALFGGQQVALPPGASATPIGGAPGVGMPGMGGGMQPQQQMMQPGMGGGMQPQQQMMQPGMQPQQQMMMPAPAHGFVDNAGNVGGMPGMPQR